MIIFLVFAIMAYVIVPKLTVTTSSTSLLTTIVTVKNIMTPPAYKIGNYTFTSASPFYPASGLPISNGYVEGVMFIYNYSNSQLLLRFLAYSNDTTALKAYDYITNYTNITVSNTTLIPISHLPANYAGVEVTQANASIYSISALHNNTIITATIVEPYTASSEAGNTVGFLVNASKLLFNQSELT